MRVLLLVMTVLGLLHAEGGAASATGPETRARLVVLTDIGGDPDDMQSMVRLMVFANEFEIEGLIASASGTPGELKKAIVQPQLIRQVVQAYGRILPNLRRHADGYPDAERLLERIKSGNPQRGWKNVGDAHDTEGSRWIIRVVDRDDARPVNITIWGGQTDLAQALWRVRADCGADGLRKFQDKIRVYDISDQDRIFADIWREFPGMFYILAKAPPRQDMRLATFRGMYLGGDESLTSRKWIDENVRIGHGPLGEQYPPKTWTAPNPHGALKEGDTPSWFYFLSLGPGDPGHPEWGGWGGRFAKDAVGVWRDAPDTVGKTAGAREAVWRWRAHFQAHFQARMDWCVQPREKANHAPLAVCNGEGGSGVVRLSARPGHKVVLSAAGSSDPDKNAISHRWWVYPEAGSYQGAIPLRSADKAEAALAVPADAAGKTIHAILEVKDDGEPPLTTVRRVVVEVQGGGDR